MTRLRSYSLPQNTVITFRGLWWWDFPVFFTTLVEFFLRLLWFLSLKANLHIRGMLSKGFRFCCTAFFACFEYQSLPGLVFNHIPSSTQRQGMIAAVSLRHCFTDLRTAEPDWLQLPNGYQAIWYCWKFTSIVFFVRWVILHTLRMHESLPLLFLLVISFLKVSFRKCKNRYPHNL